MDDFKVGDKVIAIKWKGRKESRGIVHSPTDVLWVEGMDGITGLVGTIFCVLYDRCEVEWVGMDDDQSANYYVGQRIYYVPKTQLRRATDLEVQASDLIKNVRR